MLAEILERRSGKDFRDAVEERVTHPAGLPRMIGIPRDRQTGIRALVLAGEPATAEEIQAAYRIPVAPGPVITDDFLRQFNDPAVRELGVPGAGGFGRAVDLALFYQHLLHDPNGIWDPAIRRDGTGRVRPSPPDAMGVPPNRSLGLILAGDDGRSHVRGLGRTVSPRAFGHNGAGGQVAWADPATGLSLAYLTDGFDRNELRHSRRATAISSLAAVVAGSV